MQTYLGLLQWTKEGVEKIKDSPARLDAAKKAFESAGGKITSVFMLMGQYDMAVIAEAPETRRWPASSFLLPPREESAR
jgi:uncharacterized protein with GYD domain